MKNHAAKQKNSKLNKLLVIPFVYIAVYFISLIVSLFYGAQPVLVPSFNPHKEELRKQWIAEVFEFGTLPDFFFVVATHEIESCFHNPGEVYPDGFTDYRQGREYYLEPGKLYIGQTHYIFTLGFPKTTIMACDNSNM